MHENDLKTDFTDVYQINSSGWSDFLDDAALNMSYYFDGQWTAKEQAKADLQGRDLLVVNKMKRQINLLHGYEIRNRHILKIGPTEGEDDLACRQHTGVVMHNMNTGNVNGYDILSDAFKFGSLISGSNLFEIYKDREGNLKYARHGYNSHLLDIGLTMRDLSDCDNVLLGRWISKDLAEMLLPQGSDKLNKIQPLTTTERWEYLGTPNLLNKAQKVLIESWYRRKIEYKQVVEHRVSGEIMPFDEYKQKFANNDADYAKFLINSIKLPNNIPALVKYSRPVKYIQLTMFVNGEPVWDDRNPLLIDDYPFIWLNGDFAPECEQTNHKLQGFATTLRDPQKARNRRVVQALDIIESVIQTGRAIRDKYIKNVQDAYKSGQGVPIHIKDNAPDTVPIEEIFHQFGGPDVPQGMFAMMEMLDKDLTESGGLNEEIFGSDDKDIPGILHRYRTGQALTGQQGIFQSYRSAKSELGKKHVQIQQLNYPPSKIYRIINEWPTQGFYEPDFVKYDCTPTEGLLTDSQQHLFYLELKYLRENFPDFAQIITPSMLVKYMPIQFKRELMEAIEQGEQATKQQQQQLLEDKRRMDKLIEAETTERLTQAQQQRTNSAYDQVRTMVEAKKLDSDRKLDIIDRVLKMGELEIKRQDLENKRQAVKQLPKSREKNAKKRR